jgi:hypothetical protein
MPARKTKNTTTTRVTRIERQAIMRVIIEQGGDPEKARELLLKTPEFKRVPALATLDTWTRQPDYKELEAEMAPAVAERIAAQAERIALQIEEAERMAIQKVRERLENDQDEQPAATLRNLSTSKALQIDKLSSPLRGRPTVIHGAADITELIAVLNARLGIDSTAVEIPEAEALPSGD